MIKKGIYKMGDDFSEVIKGNITLIEWLKGLYIALV